MHIYRGTIALLDYVFYATTERGKVYETGAFIHNYALTYALNLVDGDTYTYAQDVQEPHYHEELRPLNDHLYITPGMPEYVSYRLIQWNTIREGYAFPGKARSIGYPDWGFARVLRPGSSFRFYLMVSDLDKFSARYPIGDLVIGATVRVRLGKFLGKACLRVEAAEKVERRTGAFQVDAFLNWHDLNATPHICDVVASSLPTRLIANARFENTVYYEAKFQNEAVCLPARMGFLI